MINMLVSLLTAGMFGYADSRSIDGSVFLYNRWTRRIVWSHEVGGAR